MTAKLYIRQTPMGAYVWQLFNSKTGDLLGQSCEYGSRKEAREACDKISSLWPEAYAALEDQTPEAKRGIPYA